MSRKNYIAVQESNISAEIIGLYKDLNKVRSASVAALSILGR